MQCIPAESPVIATWIPAMLAQKEGPRLAFFLGELAPT
jgi:hypothetical protein